LIQFHQYIYIYIKNLKLYIFIIYKCITNIIWIKKIIYTSKYKIIIDNNNNISKIHYRYGSFILFLWIGLIQPRFDT